jgi:hypothetical protein
MTRIKWFISKEYSAHRRTTYENIVNHLESVEHVIINVDTLRHINGGNPRIKSVEGRPMERERVAVPPAEIEGFYERQHEVRTGLSAGLVFNADETGYQEWSNRIVHRVVAPVSHPNEVIEIPFNQSSKHALMLVCIAADGTSLKSMMIVQKSTAELELFEVGYTPDQPRLADRESGFFDGQLFLDWASNIFVPEVLRRRAELAYQGPSVLLLDDCPTHYLDDFLAVCADVGVLPLFLPPHSSGRTQALDVGIFGIHKRGTSRAFPPDWLTAQSKQICRLLSAWFAISTPPNITSDLKQAGVLAAWSELHNALEVRADVTTAHGLRDNRLPEEPIALAGSGSFGLLFVRQNQSGVDGGRIHE